MRETDSTTNGYEIFRILKVSYSELPSHMAMIATLIVLCTVVIVFWLDKQDTQWIKALLNWVPAILFAYVIPAGITHLFGLDLSGVYLHSVSKDWIIPLAILLVMSALSFRQLKVIGARPVLLFVSGSAVIATLPFLLVIACKFLAPDVYMMFIDSGFWKGLVPIVGGWIGGSTSQLVLKELVECPEALFLAVLVLDNVLVNIWVILMFQAIRRSEALNKYFHIDDAVPDFVPDTIDLSGDKRVYVAITLLISSLAVLASYYLIPPFVWKVVALSLLGLILGNVIPWWNHEVVLKAGSVCIVLIMAILGLKLDFGGFSLPVAFITLVVIWLLLHYIFMMLLARGLKLHMAWVPIASMANLGGISTAPAVTAAYNEEWMPHAILLAILSMVTGTLWGSITIALFSIIV